MLDNLGKTKKTWPALDEGGDDGQVDRCELPAIWCEHVGSASAGNLNSAELTQASAGHRRDLGCAATVVHEGG